MAITKEEVVNYDRQQEEDSKEELPKTWGKSWILAGCILAFIISLLFSFLIFPFFTMYYSIKLFLKLFFTKDVQSFHQNIQLIKKCSKWSFWGALFIPGLLMLEGLSIHERAYAVEVKGIDQDLVEKEQKSKKTHKKKKKNVKKEKVR